MGLGPAAEGDQLQHLPSACSAHHSGCSALTFLHNSLEKAIPRDSEIPPRAHGSLKQRPTAANPPSRRGRQWRHLSVSVESFSPPLGVEGPSAVPDLPWRTGISVALLQASVHSGTKNTGLSL